MNITKRILYIYNMITWITCTYTTKSTFIIVQSIFTYVEPTCYKMKKSLASKEAAPSS